MARERGNRADNRIKTYAPLYVVLLLLVLGLAVFLIVSYFLDEKSPVFHSVNVFPNFLIYRSFFFDDWLAIVIQVIGSAVFIFSIVFVLYKIIFSGYWRIAIAPPVIFITVSYIIIYNTIIKGYFNTSLLEILRGFFPELTYYLLFSPVNLIGNFVTFSPDFIYFLSYVIWPWYTVFVFITLNYLFVSLFFKVCSLRNIAKNEFLYSIYEEIKREDNANRKESTRFFFPLKEKILFTLVSSDNLFISPYTQSSVRLSYIVRDQFIYDYDGIDEAKALLSSLSRQMSLGLPLQHMFYISLIWPIYLIIKIFAWPFDRSRCNQTLQILKSVILFPLFLISQIFKFLFLYTEAIVWTNLMTYKADDEVGHTELGFDLLMSFVKNAKESHFLTTFSLSIFKRIYKLFDSIKSRLNDFELEEFYIEFTEINSEYLKGKDRRYYNKLIKILGEVS